MVGMSDLCLSKDSTFHQYHNVSRGIELLRTAAKHGSSEAYVRLAGEYYHGENVDKDDEKAFEYTKKAAEMRNANGTYNLGWYYIDGTGCEKDVEKGMQISYGRTYTTSKNTKIATIPIGYADGIRRCMSNKGKVLIKITRL